ncbi:MAG: diacylglycerol kinase family lipid kinase [Verrucomicrobiales bacterium]|nr:diacylglycerol kinase family lipid kinase [Verrucomicrobiales bacterium]
MRTRTANREPSSSSVGKCLQKLDLGGHLGESPGTPMRHAVIFNPTARGGASRRFREVLGGLGDDLVLKPTTGAGTAPALAVEAAREGCEVVVAAGGDGTVSEVISGLAAEPGLLERVALGVVPLGTINVFARELGLPARDIRAAWSVIRDGGDLCVDVPEVEFTAADGKVRRQAFAQLAGAGLDSRAVSLVSWPLKQKVGALAYAVAGMRALAGRQPLVQVAVGDRTMAGPLVLIGNGRLYGGSVAMQPGASLTDGRLHVRVFRSVGPALLLRFGLAFLLRRPLTPGDDLVLDAGEFSLRSEGPMPLQLDGDHVGFLPAQFRIRPGALRVRVPVQPG